MILRSTPTLVLLAAILTYGAAPSFAEDVSAKIPVGMNLSSINDYTPGYPFKNLMWSARPWLTKNADGTGPFDTMLASKMPMDENGYPLEVPFTPDGEPGQVPFTIINNLVEPGEWVLLYDGDGEIGPAMSTKIVESRPGRVVLELNGGTFGADYEGFTILRSAKGNHIRNIRIVRPEDEQADLVANPFREDFLQYCRQWHALRFMDWQVTNDSLEDEWKDRKLPTFYTMVGSGGDPLGLWGKPATEFEKRFSGGVALELLIQLANLTKTDPWFCVPHRATPEYMTEMARMIKDRLDPSLKAYVEYSNEVWNWQFQQAQWMIRVRTAAEPLAGQEFDGWAGDDIPTEFPLDNGTCARDGGADHPERMAVLMRRCFAEFEKVFSGADRKRIVRVIGVQAGWTDTIKRTADWVMAHGGADALSPSGYFGPDEEVYERWEAAGADLTPQQVIQDLDDVLERTLSCRHEAAEIASEHGLRYVVYEGGQHIQPKGQGETPYLPALNAVQFSKELADLYAKNFRIHREIGCDLFCAFASFSQQGTRWGSWGHQERIGQPREEIPKYGALLDANTPK